MNVLGEKRISWRKWNERNELIHQAKQEFSIREMIERENDIGNERERKKREKGEKKLFTFSYN